MTDEQIRLECLKLANARPHLPAEEIVATAKVLEAYITGEEPEEETAGASGHEGATPPQKRGRGRPRKPAQA